MKLSRFFLPLLREDPSEALLASHRLMLRSGMIQQAVAGIFSWLPMGHMVLERIHQIIRDEHRRMGVHEITLPSMQPTTLWEESKRSDAYGKEMLRVLDRRGRGMVYAPTNEEQVTDIFRNTVNSYKQLPLYLYLIANKFRDEIRPRFGTMRAREFVMKDAYSFDVSADAARESYQKFFAGYLRIFARMGLTAYPVRAVAGAIGGDLSHEFVIPTATGDTTILADPDYYRLTDINGSDDEVFDRWTSHYAVNEEYVEQEQQSPPEATETRQGIEIGHLFYFGQKYTAAMQAGVINQNGEKIYPYMGSYGIGTSRLVATIIEAHHDAHGIIWPEAVAPFHVALVNLDPSSSRCLETCTELYQSLQAQKISVLHDDLQDTAGVKFARADLIGAPWVITVGKKELANSHVTLKKRQHGEKISLSPHDCLARILSAKR